MTKFLVSLIQLNSQDNITANITSVENYVREAAARGAKLICTPENTFFMKEQGKGAYPDISEGIHLCTKLAAELNTWILIGSAQVPAEENKSYNRSLLISNKGKLIAQYNKIHLFDVTLKNGETYNESARVSGGSHAVIANTPLGKIGMTVCYDLRFPYLYRALATEGADFLMVPAAFTYTTGKAHWHTLLRARAIETGCYVLAPAQCGRHPGNRQTYGHSLIISPWGEIIAEGSEAETGLVMAEIDTEKVNEARQMIPSLRHGRTFTIEKATA